MTRRNEVGKNGVYFKRATEQKENKLSLEHIVLSDDSDSSFVLLTKEPNFRCKEAAPKGVFFYKEKRLFCTINIVCFDGKLGIGNLVRTRTFSPHA